MKPKFELKQIVFLNLPEGEKGRVIDIRYYFLNNYFEYFVTFGVGRAVWVHETELSSTRVFN